VTGPVEVGTRLTKAQAGEPPAHGQVFDEEEQRWMPRGEKFAVDHYRHEQQPEVMLAQHDERRTMVLKFVAKKMQEAEYDEKGYLVEGRLHHFYVVPGSRRKALTKTGAEMLADLFRLRRAGSKVTHSVETAEYVSARVECTLVDSYGQPAGAHEAACSSAEAAFRAPFARKKYGAAGDWKGPKGRREWVESGPPDYRAALNDIVSKAGKRSYVGAVIVATATDEIFEIAAAGEDERGGQEGKQGERGQEAEPKKAEPEPVPAAPTLTFQGKPLSACTTAELENASKALAKMPDHRWDRHRDAITAELEQRRVDGQFPTSLDEDPNDLRLGD
jgi:hypothetical protein